MNAHRIFGIPAWILLMIMATGSSGAEKPPPYGRIRAPQSPPDPKRQIQRLDQDGDGRISRSEAPEPDTRAGSAFGEKPSGASQERPAGTARVFVNAANASGEIDGRRWPTAFRQLQEAIDAAQKAGGGEVWVAAGTYHPTQDGDRSASFQLRPGVTVYGGFRGTETAVDERDWQENVTVLSGDIGKPGDDSDNSFHVVVGADRAIIDGFVITGGNGLDGPRGGGQPGMRRPSGPPPQGAPAGRPRGPRGTDSRGGPPPKPRFRPGGLGPGGPMPRPGPGFGPGSRPGGAIHTTPQMIASGAGPGAGAGMVNFRCAPTVRNCVFKHNKARKGGAMYNMVSQGFAPGRSRSDAPAATVTGCTFVDNFAEVRGGAVSNDLGTNPTFAECRFINNATNEKGGAIYNDFGCSPIITNCLFAGNRAFRAGAIGNDGASSPVITCCTFTKNRAEDVGAALYQGTGPANNPVVTRCVFWGNICENGPAEIVNWHDCRPVVTASCVQGNYPGEGNLDADPKFVDPARGDYALAADSPCPNAGHSAEAPKVAARREPPAAPSGRRQQQVEERPPSALPKQAVVYVNVANREGEQDGTTWQTAFTRLQQGLDYAWGCGGEVWVAEGVYKPTDEADRSAAFQLRPGVRVYGGFSGTERRRDQRNPEENVTTLSGDLGETGQPNDNCYHVLIGADEAVLDGLTITGGNADGETYDAKGGGMINYRRSPQAPPRGPAVGYSPVIRNCTFLGNRAVEGGAMYNYDRGTIELAGCTFADNSAEYGGAIVDRVGVKTTITRCAFLGNRAKWRGGALYFDYGSRPTISDASFRKNRSACHGGAIYMVSRASQLENTAPILRRCEFVNNTARKRGGAIANSDKCLLTLADCRFVENHAGAGGGALANDYRTQAALAGCTFADNSADRGRADVDTDATSRVAFEK